LTFQITPTADNSILKIYANKHYTIADLSLKRVLEKGDVDGSGVIDINDVKTLVSSILGDKPVGFFDRAADLNGDGNVDITDVTKLIEKILSSQ
jgi:Ca2+-binding EF-hand superfamily protein